MFGFITRYLRITGFSFYITVLPAFLSANKKSAIFHIKSSIKINFNVKLPIK